MGSGKLKIEVLNGRNLQNKDTFSKSDPYCMLELGTVAHKTKHLDGDLNPDWNETFTFDVDSGMDAIALSIWDKNSIKKDVFMGYSFVTFDDCQRGKPTSKVPFSQLSFRSTIFPNKTRVNRPNICSAIFLDSYDPKLDLYLSHEKLYFRNSC